MSLVTRVIYVLLKHQAGLCSCKFELVTVGWAGGGVEERERQSVTFLLVRPGQVLREK